MNNAKFGNTSNKFDNTVAMAKMMDGDNRKFINICPHTQKMAKWYLPELCFKMKIQNQFVKHEQCVTPSLQ